MELIEHLPRFLLDAFARNVTVIGVLLVVLICVRMLFRQYLTVVKDEYTYIMYNVNGFSRTLHRSGFHFNPFEWILKGRDAPDLSVSAYDEEGNKTSIKYLLNPKTGRVDLRKQLLRYKFDASSADPHKLSGFVDVLFRLDQDALNDTIKLSGFGDILKNRVLSVLREILGEHNDNDIRRKLNDLQTEALSRLEAQAKEERGHASSGADKSKQANLGVVFLGLTCHVDPGGPGRKADLQNSTLADNASFHTVMNFSVEEISSIRDEFLPNKDRQGEALQMANNAVLQMLEMHTRQQIAQALGRSGNLVILSADELGVSGDAVFWEKMRSMAGRAIGGKQNSPADDNSPGLSSDAALQPIPRKT